MTQLRCTRCGALTFALRHDQVCKICEFELNPASQLPLPPGSLVFAPSQTSPGSHGSNQTTLDSIRPFHGVTDVLGPTFSLFFENFWLITKIVVVIVAPFQLMSIFGLQEGLDDPENVLGMFLLGLLCHLLIAPPLIYSLMQVMQNGNAPTVAEAYRWGFDKLGKLAVCAAISWALQGLGLMFCIVPGILVAVSLILVFPLAVLEKSSVSEVLLDSKELTRTHRGKIFGALLILWVLTWAFTLPVQGFGEYLLVTNFNLWPVVLILSILSDIIAQSTTVLALVTYLSIRALSSQPTQ